MLRLVRSWKSFYDLLKVKVFLDANVFFAAAGSPTGGSAFVLELAKHKKIYVVTVAHALVEAERNIQKKLDREAVDRHYQNLLDIGVEIQNIDNVPSGITTALEKLLIRKDIPILLGAILSKSEFFITLDRKDFIDNKRLQEAELSFQIVTPGDFLQKWIRDYEK